MKAFNLLRTVHVIHVTVDFVDKWSKCDIFERFSLFFSFDFFNRVFDEPCLTTVQIVNVLGGKEHGCVFATSYILLKLSDSFMPVIGLFRLHQLYEVKVPFP